MNKISSQKMSHVAIIMDGNGRWAEQKKSPRSEGHKKGLDNILPIVQHLIEYKVCLLYTSDAADE